MKYSNLYIGEFTKELIIIIINNIIIITVVITLILYNNNISINKFILE